MTAPALARVLPHPAIRGTKPDRVAVAESFLLVEARRLASSLALSDVRSLLTGAALLADVVEWDEAER